MSPALSLTAVIESNCVSPPPAAIPVRLTVCSPSPSFLVMSVKASRVGASFTASTIDDARFHSARPLSASDLATVTQRVRRRLVRWFCRKGFLSREAAADMLAWQHSGFSVDASVRISPSDRDVPAYFQSLEHLLRYCARPAFALERLSVVAGRGDQPERVRYALPRHKRGDWVGPGRTRKSTRPGASGVVDLSPFEFLDRLAALIPPPRKHRHRYHGVFAPNHPLRPAVTAMAIGNIVAISEKPPTEPTGPTKSRVHARHFANRLGAAVGPGGRRVSAGVSELRR